MLDSLRKQILGDIVPPAPAPQPEVQTKAGEQTPVYPKAPLPKRFLALLIDLAVAWGPAGIVYLLMVNVESVQAIREFLWIPALLWGTVYFLVKDGWPGGQSIGKKILGLMVVTVYDRRPCSRWRSAIRQFAIIVVNFIPYIGSLVEPVLVLADKGGRRLGDQMAKTQVIETDVYNSLQ